MCDLLVDTKHIRVNSFVVCISATLSDQMILVLFVLVYLVVFIFERYAFHIIMVLCHMCLSLVGPPFRGSKWKGGSESE